MRYRIPDEVLHREVQDDTVILHASSNTYLSLNGPAGRIWRLFADGRTIDEVITTMEDEFDAPAEVLATDVATTLTELLDRGLLVPATA